MTYRWVHHNGETLYDIGILADGMLHNPNGYLDELVRAAVLGADERRRQRRSTAAKKASITRKRRQDHRILLIAQRILAGSGIGESLNCEICGRALDDPESINQGVGSECWQRVLTILEELKCKH